MGQGEQLKAGVFMEKITKIKWNFQFQTVFGRERLHISNEAMKRTFLTIDFLANRLLSYNIISPVIWVLMKAPKHWHTLQCHALFVSILLRECSFNMGGIGMGRNCDKFRNSLTIPPPIFGPVCQADQSGDRQRDTRTLRWDWFYSLHHWRWKE